MCGIAGIFQLSESERGEQLVQEIVADQHTRGPDYHKVERLTGKTGSAILGSNRLSILDLSDTAHMPMHDKDDRFVLVFNGLIYNYIELRRDLEHHGISFRTTGDTEVVLEAFRMWGTEALMRFNGMFSMAIFDCMHDTLYLARDRFGVKPLYYRVGRDHIVFASSGRVIAKHFGLQPDLSYVARGLGTLIYDDGSTTSQYEGLNALRPGHVLTCKFEGYSLKADLRQYYDFENRVTSLREELAGETGQELADRVWALLQDAVAIRLRTDVGYGVSLSGGLDSTSVAALAAGHGKPPQGFSFGHPDSGVTEGPLVELFAKHASIPVNYIWPTSQEFADSYWKTLKAQDAPFAGLSVVAQNMVFARARAMGMKVLLGGQGGDEAFMGYRKFHFFYLKKLLDEKRYGFAISMIFHMVPMFTGTHGRLRFYWNNRHRYLGRPESESVLHLPRYALPEVGLGKGEQVWQRQIKDICNFSLPTLLRYEDRNSMGNSIESRLPFLDYRLLELGAALPERLKIRGGHGKWIVRKLLETRLPDEIRLARYKRGFDVDRSGWIDRGLGREIREKLLANKHCLGDFLQDGMDIETAFSDRRMQSEPRRFTEATSLLWLASKTGSL